MRNAASEFQIVSLFKMSFICIRIKKHFHINGFALSLALKQRLGATRKWPVALLSLFLCPSLSLLYSKFVDMTINLSLIL